MLVATRKFAWGKWNSVWKDDEHAQHALYPRRRARAGTPGHVQLYSLDISWFCSCATSVDWIHIIFKSNSYHDVIWSSKLLDAGRWSWGIHSGYTKLQHCQDPVGRSPSTTVPTPVGEPGDTLNYPWADVRYSESLHDSDSWRFYQCLHNFNIYQHYNYINIITFNLSTFFSSVGDPHTLVIPSQLLELLTIDKVVGATYVLLVGLGC